MNISLELPVDKRYRISQKFGENSQNYSKFGFSGHEGVDYAAPLGSRVSTAADGIVWKVGSLLGGVNAKTNPERAGAYGNRVIMKHQFGALVGFTIYAHLDSWVVHEGDSIKAGQLVGFSGNTGRSTGPHLHWSLCLPVINDGYKAPSSISRRKLYPLIELWYHDPLKYLVNNNQS